MGWILWLVSCLLLGCHPESDIKVLRLAHTLDTTHPVHAALVFMAKELETRSAGRMRIKIYPGSQLGSERETIELLQLGAVDLVKTSTSPLEGFIPGMGVFGIPYVFRVLNISGRCSKVRSGRSCFRQGSTRNSRVSVTTMLAAGVFTPRRKQCVPQTI